MATAAELSTYLTYSASQENALIATERTASVISILSCLFVFTTFSTSKRFRKPVNRILFYATIGNFLMTIGTTTSLGGIYAGKDSPLCQVQGFLIQMFLPADALWNLSMALNTYLAVFKQWPASRLKSLDKWYFLFNYGSSFIVAFVYCFINTSARGKMYGPAVLWCWIDSKWDVFRVITCYAPAWVAIFTSFCIYFAAGVNIYRKRNHLRAFRLTKVSGASAEPSTSYNTNSRSAGLAHWSEHHIKTTTELKVTSKSAVEQTELDDFGGKTLRDEHSYICTAEAVPFNPFSEFGPRPLNGKQLATATLEANDAAVGYAKCAMLFFVSLMFTWVPSSIFRVSLVVSPSVHNYGLAYATGLVLPLQGFWNAIIYVVTSRSAVTAWFTEDLGLGEFLVKIGLRKAPSVDVAATWPPVMSPKARSERFARTDSSRKDSKNGSFDRLCEGAYA